MRSYIVLIAVLVASICLLSCSSLPLNTLTVGVLSWPGDGPLYIAEEKGFFKEEGIVVNLRLIESYDSRRAALTAGSIDIDCNTLDQLLIYAGNGIDAKVFGISDFSNGGDAIIAKKEIRDLSELQGKTITYAEASPSEFF